MPNILNVAPIFFENCIIEGEYFPYSDEKKEELLNHYRNSHLIKREGDKLIAISTKSGQSRLGGIVQSFELKDNLSLVRSLAIKSLFKELYFRDCWIYSSKPLIYLKNKQNLLNDCLPEGVRPIKGLAVFPKYEIDFRIIDTMSTGPFVGLSLNLSLAPRISINCYELMRNGVPILGYYVGKAYGGRNPDLKPRFTTLGKVKSVNEDGMLVLDDVKSSEDELVDPTIVFLEPREDLLEYCIRHLYKTKANEILSNLDRQLLQYHTGNNKYNKLNKALKTYQQFNLSLVEGIMFSLGDFLMDNNGKYHIKVFNAGKPVFVYGHGGTKTNTYNDIGLQNYGPYSREDFTPSKPNICIIAQKNKRGQVEQVIQKFINGIPPAAFGKQGKTFEFTGLKNKFRIQDFSYEFFEAENSTIEAYNKAISAALKKSGDTKPFNLALVQIDNNFRDRKPNENPYLVAKARFIGQQISVQEFTLESLSLPDSRIMWSLNNMALATYAKMGGVPWLLTADAPMAHEIVFGIGSAMIYTSRLAAKQRMVGITTVFKGDGRYFINNISSAVLMEDYFETLLENLRNTIERVKIDFNWRPKDSVRLVFHAFKTFADNEVNAVKKVMSELGEFNVEFAFVHVAQNHPYMLFDYSQKGFFGKGAFVPERGRYLQLTEHISLVMLTGPTELKKASDGNPRPIQLVLHRDSTFRDMPYLSKQVIKFGAHSWRSFAPAPMPVSVYYSQLMAQMLSQLTGVSSWNPDAIYNKIGTTRWFL
ncbi:argonaute/piwi family protein [Sphingobacterium sp. UBA5670]|uniref:argonaute/piwi family protein n=1 Tax=Sphingobacterium sp. UBA5670 TaxID=1947502 RepID=UPI0025FC8434|nr:Piwi domain-containing protein [Sphingobacterium sp. UBA5670]